MADEMMDQATAELTLETLSRCYPQAGPFKLTDEDEGDISITLYTTDKGVVLWSNNRECVLAKLGKDKSSYADALAAYRTY